MVGLLIVSAAPATAEQPAPVKTEPAATRAVAWLSQTTGLSGELAVILALVCSAMATSAQASRRKRVRAILS